MKQRMTLNLELSAVCSAGCVFCKEDERKREIRSMAPEIAREAIRQAADLGFTEMHPQMWGEPTTFPRYLADAIACARRRGMITVVYSNGSGAPLDRVPEQVPHSMRWSLNAHNPRLLEKISPGLCWEDVYANVTGWWRSHGHLAPFHEIVGRITKCPENQHEIEAIRAFWMPYVHKVAVVPEFPLRRKVEGFVLDDAFLCHASEDSLAILSDGRVVGCCVDQEGNMEIGRFPDQTLAEIINSAPAQTFRRKLREREWFPLCQRCGFRDLRRRTK